MVKGVRGERSSPLDSGYGFYTLGIIGEPADQQDPAGCMYTGGTIIVPRKFGWYRDEYLHVSCGSASSRALVNQVRGTWTGFESRAARVQGMKASIHAAAGFSADAFAPAAAYSVVSSTPLVVRMLLTLAYRQA